jgi:hypothetical protein
MSSSQEWLRNRNLDIQTLDSQQLIEEEIGTIAPMQPAQGTVDPLSNATVTPTQEEQHIEAQG